MKFVIVILACLLPYSLGYGGYGQHSGGHNNAPQNVLYTGLRVKYGPSAAQADKDYFFKIPRTIGTAMSDGWWQTRRPPGPLPHLTMLCPPGRAVCPLYDPDSGFIAGLQLALPVEDYQFMNPESKFVLWHAPANTREPARDYWTATQYYVSEEALDSGEGPVLEDGNTLQEDGVWVSGRGGRLTRLPLSEAALNGSQFTRQHCIPSMGNHYYWRMSPELKCEELLPWFGLTTKGRLTGVGFIMFGRLAPQQPRHYFEVPPSRDQVSVPIIPSAPQCLWDLQASVGMLTMHIYYVDDPWNITCD